jgi:hypothetical protein
MDAGEPLAIANDGRFDAKGAIAKTTEEGRKHMPFETCCKARRSLQNSRDGVFVLISSHT